MDNVCERCGRERADPTVTYAFYRGSPAYDLCHGDDSKFAQLCSAAAYKRSHKVIIGHSRCGDDCEVKRLYDRTADCQRLDKELKTVRAEVERWKAEADVLSGRGCDEEQADGNGPCGACVKCLRAEIEQLKKKSTDLKDDWLAAEKDLREARQITHADVERLREALGEVKDCLVDYGREHESCIDTIDAALASKEADVQPIPMVLHCPNCRTQHIDKPEPEIGWTNPPHKSHLCRNCNTIWRPADVPTVGVEAIKTRGEADTWPLLGTS